MGSIFKFCYRAHGGWQKVEMGTAFRDSYCEIHKREGELWHECCRSNTKFWKYELNIMEIHLKVVIGKRKEAVIHPTSLYMSIFSIYYHGIVSTFERC